MNHQYSNGQGYPPSYLNGGRHNPGPDPLSSSSSTPQRHASNLSTQSGPQTLPPIAAPHYAPALSQDVYASRAQPLQPSLPTSGPGSLNQPALLPIYAPTATTYFSSTGPVSTYSQPPASQQPYRTSAPQYATQQTQPNPSYPSSDNSTQPSRLPDLRPMPVQTLSAESTATSKNGRSLASAKTMGDDSQPIHVVGSQGRRGILPSAAGRPPAIGENASNGPKGSAAPAKDADGKYPCEHCPKTYLHAKHLKRHMLRHTGVRPYTCGLCRDTFSRSDILKRHFQKCSVRRGNPTGESHLSHSRANKKAKAEEEEASSTEHTATPTDQSQPSSAFTSTGFEAALDLRNLDLTQANFPDGQPPALNHMSRSNSIRKQKTSRSSSNRGSMGAVPTSGYEATNYAYSTGHVTPDSITTSGAATPYTYPHEARSNQISPENQVANGIGLPSGPSSRPSIVSNYSTGSLPHIMGQPSGRGHDLEWLSHHHFQSQEEFGHAQYHSGTVTPHHQKEEMVDFIPMNAFNFSK